MGCRLGGRTYRLGRHRNCGPGVWTGPKDHSKRETRTPRRSGRATAGANSEAWRRPTQGGKKSAALRLAVLRLVQPELAGHPVTGALWIRKSIYKLLEALAAQGFAVGKTALRRVLAKEGIRLKSNVKRLAPKVHPQRDEQFRYIVRMRRRFERKKQPIASVDAKQKELVGRFRNRGRTWQIEPTVVNTYDYPNLAEYKATPYGIYDTQLNLGFVVVGISRNTPAFAVTSIAMWWSLSGRRHHPGARHLLILADGGGSNGYRARAWKVELQKQLVDAYELRVTVCHYPTGASKWNPVEHRLFSEISKTWAGTPLTSLEVIISALKATKTAGGLRVEARLLLEIFEKQEITEAEVAKMSIKRHKVCPAWNYTLSPRKKGK